MGVEAKKTKIESHLPPINPARSREDLKRCQLPPNMNEGFPIEHHYNSHKHLRDLVCFRGQ